MLQGKSEGTHHQGELLSEEFWKILDLMAKQGTVKPRDVHPEILDYRNIITVRRACYVAKLYGRWIVRLWGLYSSKN